MRVLVLGGAGFVGRHAVTALLARGHDVVIGSRHPQRVGHRLPAQAHQCDRLSVQFDQLLSIEKWAPLLAGVDVVINCVGILRQRGLETYEKVHHIAPVALAEACSRAGVQRMLHVSALGLDNRVTSRFLTSKRRGEAGLRDCSFDCVIVRPSLLDGSDGYGARWVRSVARWPVHFLPASAKGRIAPLDVGDLGIALAVLCELETLPSLEIELGGDEQMTIGQYLTRLRGQQRGAWARPALMISVPHWLARGVSHLCDFFHITPFSFGHLQLMRYDNVPRNNALPNLLDRDRRRKFVA